MTVTKPKIVLTPPSTPQYLEKYSGATSYQVELIRTRYSPWSTMKANVKKKSLKFEVNEDWSSNVRNRVVRGKCPQLLIDMNQNIIWKSLIYNLPREVMQVAV